MSAAPMFAQLLAPAGENWNWRELNVDRAGRVGQVRDPAQVVAGVTAQPLGAVVSMTTSTVLAGASTFPTSSVEKNETVCVPSFEWSPGAGITTELPWSREPPSTRYSVFATPEPVPSAAEKLTVTGALLGLPGASRGEVVGAV